MRLSTTAEWMTFCQQNMGKMILIDFTSEGCGLCRMMARSMRAIRERYANRVAFAQIDMDDAIRSGWEWARVQGLPAFRLFRWDGDRHRMVEEWPGSNIETVENRLKRYVE